MTRLYINYIFVNSLIALYSLSAQAGGLVLTSEEIQGSQSQKGISRNSGGATSVAITIGVTIGLSTEGLNPPTEKQTAQFQARYKESPRAMSRDLKRLSGPQYKWLVSTSLRIDKEERKFFRCELKKNREQLKSLIEQCVGLRDQDLQTLYVFLKQQKREAHRGSCP